MAARDVLKNFNLFVDGRGYAGQVQDFTPPDLTLTTEDFRAGGMDMPISLDMGMEVMETSFNLLSYDFNALTQFGIGEGNIVSLVGRGALESYDGTVTAVEITMKGKLTAVGRGTWTPGQGAPVQITARLHYYKEVHGQTTLFEIDAQNMVRIINGTDRLAAQRAALGI